MVLPFCPSFPKPSLVRQEVPKLPHLVMILGDGMAQISHHFRSWNPHRRLRVEHFHVHTFQCLTWQATLPRLSSGEMVTVDPQPIRLTLILVLFYNVSPESLAKRFLLRKTVADIDEFGPSSPNRLRKGLETCIQHSLHPTEKHTPENPVLKL